MVKSRGGLETVASRAGTRYPTAQIERDLPRKRVLVAGLRFATAQDAESTSSSKAAGRGCSSKRGGTRGPLDSNLRYLKERYPGADAWRIHAHGAEDNVTPEGIRVAPALELLKALV